MQRNLGIALQIIVIFFHLAIKHTSYSKFQTLRHWLGGYGLTINHRFRNFVIWTVGLHPAAFCWQYQFSTRPVQLAQKLGNVDISRRFVAGHQTGWSWRSWPAAVFSVTNASTHTNSTSRDKTNSAGHTPIRPTNNQNNTHTHMHKVKYSQRQLTMSWANSWIFHHHHNHYL